MGFPILEKYGKKGFQDCRPMPTTEPHNTNRGATINALPDSRPGQGDIFAPARNLVWGLGGPTKMAGMIPAARYSSLQTWYISVYHPISSMNTGDLYQVLIIPCLIGNLTRE